MEKLGITPEINQVMLWQTEIMPGPDQGKAALKPFPIFRPSAKGIEILVYDINQVIIKTIKDATRSGIEVKVVDKNYAITRLEVPIVRRNGDIQKYTKPAGLPSYPFFPPNLTYKYNSAAAIHTLYVTEGFFKAFKADMCGINCVGLQSITCLRDKATNTIWSDISNIVTTCQVRRIVWLTDGDFDSITAKELTVGTDLYKRPNIFFSSVYTFWELTSQLQCERYFAHINTESLGTANSPGPKGLDDLLCQFTDEAAEIAIDLNNFSIMAPGKVYPGKYVTKMSISHGTGNVHKYILKGDVTAFYLHHLERRPDLANIANFKYNGTLYSYDPKEGKCVVEIPGAAADYLRMGNDYYKFITAPDKHGKPIRRMAGRLKSTIIDDHGKTFINHIVKYDGACIQADHVNYQQVVNNNYNLYNKFPHEAEEGDCSATLEFIKHIFSEEMVIYKLDVIKEIPRYELGLDYISLLYKKPTQILPILCPVSRERSTGKTTFINYLEELFKDNAISIGNEDMEADFNAHWAGKLLISVDETKVDNNKVVNKIKRLSTAESIILNSKGKDQAPLPFFAKFILSSNHVDDFIRIDREEIRFWIIEVKQIKVKNTELAAQLREEIPAFLHYLNSRKMVTEKKERHWFDTQLLQTNAQDAVKANSVSGMEKRIRTQVQMMFEMSNMERITIPTADIAAQLKNAEVEYMRKTLKEMGYMTKSGRYLWPRRTERIVIAGAEYEQGIELVKGNNSHYEFERKNFTTVPTVPADHFRNTDLDLDYLPF